MKTSRSLMDRRELVIGNGGVMSAVAERVETTRTRVPLQGGISLDVEVTVPAGATGLVLFTHGSASPRHAPRNQYIASQLNFVRIGTALTELMTAPEKAAGEQTPAVPLDTSLLAERLVLLIDWVKQSSELGELPLGLTCAGACAAAALDAAAARPLDVEALVLRSARTDLARHLDGVRAATLFLAGGSDPLVVERSSSAVRTMSCTRELEIVPGAAHLFDEPGALEVVASATAAWFRRFLTQPGRTAR
jgi:predicted alpha/beta-hydrolase family hydrolase